MRVYVITRALVCALNRPKIQKSFDTCNFFARYQKPFSLSHCLIVVFLGLWDYGTVGLWDVAANRKKNFSRCLIVSFSHCLFFGKWDYVTMGLWDVAATN